MLTELLAYYLTSCRGSGGIAEPQRPGTNLRDEQNKTKWLFIFFHPTSIPIADKDLLLLVLFVYVLGGFLILVEKELCLLWAIEKPVFTAFLGFDYNILFCLSVS